MNSPESFNKSYWTDEIKKLRNRIAELRLFVSDSQNSQSPEGDDTSESMVEAELELAQLEANLKEARMALALIECQDEVTGLLPRIEELKNQIEMHKKIDVQEARELEVVLKELEARVEKLRDTPTLNDEEEG